MSRTLSKILVICAMVAVFPLMIVGTVFASYFSVEANLAVEVYVNAYSQSEDAYARIDSGNQTIAIEKIGESDKKEEISQGHLSEVTLSANCEGYTFEGWFVGDGKEYALAHQNGTAELIEDETLNFVITDYAKLTAIFNIVEYTIGYNYQATPGAETTTTAPTDNGGNALTSFNYGEALPELAFNGLSHKFGGWKLVGDTSDKVYEVAIFDESIENIVLEAIWVEQPKFDVKYFDANAQELKTVSDIYYGTEYTALAISDVVPADKIKAGHQYSWQDVNGNTLSSAYVVMEDFNIYLKEEEIKYSAKLTTTGAIFDGYTEATFGIKSNSSIQAWFVLENWSTEQSYNTVTALKVGETTYEINETGLSSFLNGIVTANPTSAPETATEIEVVVEEYFTTFKVSNGITFGTSGIDTDVYLFDDGFAFTLPGARTFDSTKTVYELLNLKEEESVTKLYNADGYEVTLKYLIINGISIEVTGNETLSEVIEIMYNDDRFAEVSLGEEYTVSTIHAYFA